MLEADPPESEIDTTGIEVPETWHRTEQVDELAASFAENAVWEALVTLVMGSNDLSRTLLAGDSELAGLLQ